MHFADCASVFPPLSYLQVCVKLNTSRLDAVCFLLCCQTLHMSCLFPLFSSEDTMKQSMKGCILEGIFTAVW